MKRLLFKIEMIPTPIKYFFLTSLGPPLLYVLIAHVFVGAG